jgi:predicted O-methyltransferase YrrM
MRLVWPYVALPALQKVLPKLKPGSVVVTDNSLSSSVGYKELLEILRDPKGQFVSVTLPYKGGLEMSVYTP